VEVVVVDSAADSAVGALAAVVAAVVGPGVAVRPAVIPNVARAKVATSLLKRSCSSIDLPRL